MSKKVTEELLNELSRTIDINQFIINNESNFSDLSIHEILNQLLFEKGLTKKEVIKSSGIDRAYGYQIFSGIKVPSREKLIALSFGLTLTLDETQKLLKLSGNRELYPRDKRDSVILFAIKKRQSLIGTNELLLELQLDLIAQPL